MSGEFRFPNGDIEFFRDGPGAAARLGGDTDEIPSATQAALDQKADLDATQAALNGKVGSATVKTITTITQAAYDAMGTKDPNTMYVVTG